MSSETIRVAHIITHLDIGGAETSLARLIDQSPETFSHSVWSLHSGGRIGAGLRHRNVPVRELGLKSPGGAFTRCRAGMAELRAFDPHILQGWMYHGNVAANLAHRALGSRPSLAWNVRGSLHATEREKFLTRAVMSLGRFMARRPDCIVNNSRASAADHIRNGYPRNVWKVIPNGFDTNVFRPRLPEERARLRQMFGLPNDCLVVGTVGRNHPVKGHENMIQALTRLRAPAEHFVAVLAGPGWELGSAAVSELPTRSGISWHCLGAVSNIDELIPCLDVFCLPSLSEGFPNALGEAMSCGVASVATDVGDVKHLLGDGGIVVPPGDVGALAAALGSLVTSTIDRRREFGARGRERIEALFPLTGAVSAYGQLYLDLASGREIGADC